MIDPANKIKLRSFDFDIRYSRGALSAAKRFRQNAGTVLLFGEEVKAWTALCSDPNHRNIDSDVL